MELQTMKPGVNLKRKTKMKKIMKNSLWIALGAIALTACSTDGTEDIQPANPTPDTPETGGGRTITVVASLGDDTKASFTDTEGIRWAVGETLTSIAYRAPENGEWTWTHSSNTVETASTTGDFTFQDIQPDEKEVPVWFIQQATAAGDAKQVEFQNHNRDEEGEHVQLQAKAGEMNSRYLLLTSKQTSWEEMSEEGASVKMQILGHILRFIPYSSVETYRQESVKSIKFVTRDTGIGGIIRRNLVEGSGDLYGGFNDLTVQLTESFALTDADSKANSHGIYMTIAPVGNIDGYSITVTTDVAIYTFNGLEKTMTLPEDGVLNIGLDLKNGVRVEIDNYLYDVRYQGDFNTVENTLWTSEAHPEIVNGYWFAQAALKGTQTWETKDNNTEENWKFYKDISFEIIDQETNAPADWVTCTQSTSGTVWRIALTENLSRKERSATIKATYPDTFEGGYVLLPEYKTKTITITQAANIEIIAELSEIYTETIDKDGEEIASAAKLTITIDGTAATDVKAAMQEYGISIACGTATAEVAENGTVKILFPKNSSSKEKTYTLNVKYKNDTIATAEFTQAAGEGGGEEAIFEYTISWCAWGEDMTKMEFSSNMDATYRFLWIDNVKKNNESITGEMTDEDYAALRAQLLKVGEIDGVPGDDSFILTKIGASGNQYFVDCGTTESTGNIEEVRWLICNSDGSTYRDIIIRKNP